MLPVSSLMSWSLFKDGKVFSHGSPDQVMTEDILGRLYDMKITIADTMARKSAYIDKDGIYEKA